MVRVNCHVHSNESDGSLSPRELLERAVEEGLGCVCFTDHFRMPKEIRDYGEARKHGDDYYDELEKLRVEFAGKVDVLIGVELDWVDGYEDWFLSEMGDRDYDFILGAVHWLKNLDGDFSRPHFPTGGIEEFGGERIFIENYFGEIRKMIEFGGIDCVAHLDAFRKRLESNGVLCEDWYKDLVVDLLRLMKEREVVLEVNCAGWEVLDECFPQRWIVEEAVRLGVGLTIGNDFHKLKFGRLDEGIDRAVEMLREVGAQEILVFRGRIGERMKV